MFSDEDDEIRYGDIVEGRFIIDSFLGKGGFGAVYSAQQKIFNTPIRKVAIKIFKSGFIDEENASDKLNDAIMLAKILEGAIPEQKRHMIDLYDAGIFRDKQNNPRGYVVMELLEGNDLSKYITLHKRGEEKPNKRSIKLALNFTRQICDGLRLPHDHKPEAIIHRDIKPGNIFLQDIKEQDNQTHQSSHNKNIRILDYGLAKDIHFLFKDTRSAGTISYQAPECFTKESCTIKTDIYSVGLVMYELLTFNHPFSWFGERLSVINKDKEYAEAQLEIRKRLMKEEFLVPFNERSGVKGYKILNQIITRCLSFEPEHRFNSVQELKKSIEAYENEVYKEDTDIYKETTAEKVERLWKEAQFCIKSGGGIIQHRKAETKLEEAVHLIKGTELESKFYDMFLCKAEVLEFLDQSADDPEHLLLWKAIQIVREVALKQTNNLQANTLFSKLSDKYQKLTR